MRRKGLDPKATKSKAVQALTPKTEEKEKAAPTVVDESKEVSGAHGGTALGSSTKQESVKSGNNNAGKKSGAAGAKTKSKK